MILSLICYLDPASFYQKYIFKRNTPSKNTDVTQRLNNFKWLNPQ